MTLHLRPLALMGAIMMAACGFLQAENNAMSPYSRFGYGILNDRASSTQRAMGGVGYAMNNGRQINAMNPASYANIDSLTFLFDVGADIKWLDASDNGQKGSRFGGGLDYITMQFPLGKNVGGSLGLIPFSEVGYSFGDEIVNGHDSHQGSGTVNELYAGLSWRPVRGLSIGANIGYMFGTLINDTYLMPDASTTSLFERVMEIRDYSLTLGAQYTFRPYGDNAFTIGATFAPAKDWHGKTYGVSYDLSAATSTTNPSLPDTIANYRLSHGYTMPATYGIGLNYRLGTRLMVEADYTYQPWKKAEYRPMPGFEQSRFDNRWRAAIGAEYTPDSRGGYLRRVSYRLGAYYNHDYIMAGSNKVNDYGVTLGFGLPTPVNRWTKTVVNIALEYRHRQSSPVSLVKENYFQLTVGVNFNELWFWKNKIQ